MNVTVNYEAQLRLTAGINSETLDLAEGCSLVELLRHAAELHGTALADRLLTADGQPQPGVLFFVNGEPVPPKSAAGQLLHAGDTVLLYPPISGG